MDTEHIESKTRTRNTLNVKVESLHIMLPLGENKGYKKAGQKENSKEHIQGKQTMASFQVAPGAKPHPANEGRNKFLKIGYAGVPAFCSLGRRDEAQTLP